jgi:hypothetical protein
MLSFTDEKMDQFHTLASPLPPSLRDAFLQFVAVKLAAHPDQKRGPGMLHKIALDAQRTFLQGNGAVAVGPGGKYSRGQPKR